MVADRSSVPKNECQAPVSSSFAVFKFLRGFSEAIPVVMLGAVRDSNRP